MKQGNVVHWFLHVGNLGLPVIAITRRCGSLIFVYARNEPVYLASNPKWKACNWGYSISSPCLLYIAAADVVHWLVMFSKRCTAELTQALSLPCLQAASRCHWTSPENPGQLAAPEHDNEFIVWSDFLQPNSLRLSLSPKIEIGRKFNPLGFIRQTTTQHYRN